VKKITFVDNGTVSFSNPVRQPLFNFEDCLNGGVLKAHRASEALTQIYPGVETTGHALSVPMAGHPIVDEDVTRSDFDRLKTLINEHDAIFLLMDTRESRWLPTVMGKAAGKIVMNAALGFDSFVVMRHGTTEDEDLPAELGCYFCNDVVAPANVRLSNQGPTLYRTDCRIVYQRSNSRPAVYSDPPWSGSYSLCTFGGAFCVTPSAPQRCCRTGSHDPQY
jgi:hypothetical protein